MIKAAALVLTAALSAPADTDRLKIILVAPGSRFQCTSPNGCVVMDAGTFPKVIKAARDRGQSDCEKAI